MRKNRSGKFSWGFLAIIGGLLSVCLMLAVLWFQARPRPAEFHLNETAPAWEPEPPRATLDELEKAFEKELLAANAEVEALRAERQAMPVKERCRIRAGADAFTSTKAREQKLQYRMETVSWYRQTTRDSGEGKRLGEKFLTEYAKYAASIPNALGVEALRELAESSIKAGAADPMLRLYYGRILSHSDQMSQALQIFEEVRNLVVYGEYPSVAKFHAVTWPSLIPQEIYTFGQRRLEPPVIEATIAYLRDDAACENQRLLYEAIDGMYSSAVPSSRRAFLEALLSGADIDPWIKHMFMGRYYRDRAWDARGGGWASKVTREGWEEFGKYLPRAAAHFRRAWQLHPEYPEGAVALINIAKAGGDQQWTPRDWFYEAVRAQLDYTPAYSSLRGALQPRWGGSYEEMLTFAAECVDTNRWDTCVPNQVIDTLYAIQQESPDPDEFVSSPGVAAITKAYAERLLKAAEADPLIPGNYSEIWAYLAATLVRAEEYALARTIFEKWGGDIRQHDLAWADMKLATVRGRAYAHTGPASQQIRQLEQALAANDAEDLPLETFKALREQLDKARDLDESPELQPYLNDFAAVLGQLERFHAGETVELPLDDSLTGWYVRGEVRQEPDQALRISSYQGRGGAQLKPLAFFSPPFVVEAEIADEVDGNSHGIIIGPSDNRAVYHNDLRRCLLANASAHSVQSVVGEDPERNRSIPVEPKPFYRFEVRLWPGRIQMLLDGTLCVDTAAIADGVSSKITIGGLMPDPLPAAFKCRNVRIRRLTEDPPPKSSCDSLPETQREGESVQPAAAEL